MALIDVVTYIKKALDYWSLRMQVQYWSKFPPCKANTWEGTLKILPHSALQIAFLSERSFLEAYKGVE